MRLTEAELAEMPEKSKRDAETLALYREHPFLDAYALHTAKRIETTGYKAAIGGGDNWDEHGELQRDFLVSQGLMPWHRLLDIGCGTGRLARKATEYLSPGGYHGLDIAQAAIAAARDLAAAEGWDVKRPTFWVGELPADARAFDFVWSFSVFIHLPRSIMESVMRAAAAKMHPGSVFLWAYVPEHRAYRSGVKQFRHTLADYRDAAQCAGLSFEDVPHWINDAGYEPGRWSGHQRVARSRLWRA